MQSHIKITNIFDCASQTKHWLNIGHLKTYIATTKLCIWIIIRSQTLRESCYIIWSLNLSKTSSQIVKHGWILVIGIYLLWQPGPHMINYSVATVMLLHIDLFLHPCCHIIFILKPKLKRLRRWLNIGETLANRNHLAALAWLQSLVADATCLVNFFLVSLF